jgi:hypothetical protein
MVKGKAIINSTVFAAYDIGGIYAAKRAGGPSNYRLV